jgi:cytosine deaminase
MTPYFKDLHDAIMAYGGLFNAHLHLDRAGTYHATVDILRDQGVKDGTVLPLAGKHAIISSIHASACYDPPELYRRVDGYVKDMIACGTTRADTVVDVTTDRVGLSALETFARLKADNASQIDLRFGAYSPAGFRDDEPGRWSLIEQGAGLADFVGLLPERDDTDDYPDHIGFEASCRRSIELAHRLGKPIHIHADQANHAHENFTEVIARLVRDMDLGLPPGTEPFIWLVHVISPSCYDEPRFAALAQELAALNIGVICCPAAALSMRQYRSFTSPTHNSIARVLDMVLAGVQVRIGSDNVCDITSPMGTPNLMDEVRVLGDTMRYYDIDFLARIATGKPIEADGLNRLSAHLATDAMFADKVVRRFGKP